MGLIIMSGLPNTTPASSKSWMHLMLHSSLQNVIMAFDENKSCGDDNNALK
jgi:hypothetical protein